MTAWLEKWQGFVTPMISTCVPDDCRKDFGVAESMTSLLDMVKVMQFAISEGKVAVHCHAGKGKLLYAIVVVTVFPSCSDSFHVSCYLSTTCSFIFRLIGVVFSYRSYWRADCMLFSI